MCSPPLREPSDQEALWWALEIGTLQTVSSDHAPYRMDASGKLAKGPRPNFKEIANGMPGLELRLPVLFDAMVSRGRLGLEKFVELTATAPGAALRPAPRQGQHRRRRRRRPRDLGSRARRSRSRRARATTAPATRPSPGRTLKGWPVTVLRRGEVIVADGELARRPRLRPLPAACGGGPARPARPAGAGAGPGAQFRRGPARLSGRRQPGAPGLEPGDVVQLPLGGLEASGRAAGPG